MVRRGVHLVITAPSETLAELDKRLWNLRADDFVAHCRADAPESLLDTSPVLLLEDPRQARHRGVLFNLGDGIPQGCAEFGQLIEMVSAHDPIDQAHGRERWRYYAQQGYTLTTYGNNGSQ